MSCQILVYFFKAYCMYTCNISKAVVIFRHFLGAYQVSINLLLMKKNSSKIILLKKRKTELFSQTFDSCCDTVLISNLSVNFSQSITQWQTVFNDNSFHITWWPWTCPFWLAKRQQKKWQLLLHEVQQRLVIHQRKTSNHFYDRMPLENCVIFF